MFVIVIVIKKVRDTSSPSIVVIPTSTRPHTSTNTLGELFKLARIQITLSLSPIPRHISFQTPLPSYPRLLATQPDSQSCVED